MPGYLVTFRIDEWEVDPQLAAENAWSDLQAIYNDEKGLEVDVLEHNSNKTHTVYIKKETTL